MYVKSVEEDLKVQKVKKLVMDLFAMKRYLGINGRPKVKIKNQKQYIIGF